MNKKLNNENKILYGTVAFLSLLLLAILAIDFKILQSMGIL